MANVYTRRDGKPRTTTFSDFKFHKDYSYGNTGKNKLPRLFSPIRRHNPHSLGLIYQSPYNKDNLTFSIWSPPFKVICKNFSDKFSHMQETNWTCKHETRNENILERRKPPKIRYSTSSTSRQSYQDPAKRMTKWKISSPTLPTRYSSNPDPDPVAGIVPNAVVLPPLNKDEKEKKMPPNPVKILTDVINEET